MSQTPTNTRPTEEAFAALLIIATLTFGGLYVVAKTAGNRFVGSPLKKDERGTNADEDDEKSKASPEKEQHLLEFDGDSTNIVQNDRSRMEVNNENDKVPPIQTKAQATQPPRDHNRQEGLDAIRAWEEATTDRIQRQKAKKLNQLPSLCQRREIDSKQGLEAILAWEQSTMGRFQHERKRRLDRLAALD